MKTQWLKSIARSRQTIIRALYLAEQWEAQLAACWPPGRERTTAVRSAERYKRLRHAILKSNGN